MDAHVDIKARHFHIGCKGEDYDNKGRSLEVA